MKNSIIPIAALMIVFLLSVEHLLGIQIHYNQACNEIEITSEFEVKDSAVRNPEAGNYHNWIHTIPHQKAKFVVSAPRTVYVGQIFNIYFSIHPESKVNIPFWADLIPDSLQASAHGLKYISHSMPTLGTFDESSESTLLKGGKGIWKTPGIVNSRGVVHMSVTLQATSKGKKKYNTMIATNPPASLEITIEGSQEHPVAVADYGVGLQNKSLTIRVLDNDYGMCALRVIEVSQGMHGTVMINPDNTLVYMPEHDFVGTDTFIYMIEDEAGNRAQAEVVVMIAECPPPQVIR